MSRNFELMRQVGKGIGQRRPAHVAVAPVDNSAGQLMGPAGAEEAKSADWLQAFGILQKHWKLSALFACVVMVTVAVFTVLSKPIYEPGTRPPPHTPDSDSQ